VRNSEKFPRFVFCVSGSRLGKVEREACGHVPENADSHSQFPESQLFETLILQTEEWTLEPRGLPRRSSNETEWYKGIQWPVRGKGDGRYREAEKSMVRWT